MRLPVLLLCAFQASVVAAEPVFRDISDALPNEHIYDGGWEHFVGGGVAVLDCNGDTKPDIFAAGGENPAQLFVNESPEAGVIRFANGAIDPITGATGAYPLDIDGDGHLDLFVLRVGPNVILKGNGACGFTDHTSASGMVNGNRWSTAFSATWESDDGLPTFAIGNYVDRGNPDGPFEACDGNEIHRGVDGLYSAHTMLLPGYCALSMLISDWQRTGAPELRISNDRHYYVSGGYEEMWRLNPPRPRTERDGWQKVSLWGMGIASADLTGDGFPEVMLTSMGDQLLQINDRGHLRNAPYDVGTYAQRPFIGDDGRPSTGWHAEFADVNNDGLLDLFIAKGNVDQMPSNAMADPNNLLVQSSSGTFREKADIAGVATTDRSRGAALADFDLDGRLDLVVVNRRAPMELYRNETPDTGNWLGVDLRMDGANTRAIGAWIELRAGANVQVREVTVGGGHAGGQAGPVHFGLGDAKIADVRVTWPNGHSSDWISHDANQRVVLRP